jgi:phenylalanyl-tRNA synthetase alpha chain
VDIEQKAGTNLATLGVNEPSGVASLFAEVQQGLESERSAALVDAAKANGNERERLVKALRDRWLARKNGILTLIDQNWLKTASKQLKPSVGREFNQLRQLAARLMETESLVADLAASPVPGKATDVSAGAAGAVDLALPAYRRPVGSLHPVMRVQREIEDIFLSLGFSVETGPEIESVYYNFDALNIPESHPARDDWDTLYINAQTVLRTHTSPVQIRAMEKYGAPLYIVIPGKCYRRDNPDSTHSPMFHQIEGLAIDRDITFADLKGALDFFAKKFFGENVRTSFHPSFFPFTEPSGQMDVSCPFCEGTGYRSAGEPCRTCKESGWIEVMGCGMVHPSVLRNGGIDPEKYSGWAFGLGTDRFALLKYGINDIQLFFQGDVRFLEQF